MRVSGARNGPGSGPTRRELATNLQHLSKFRRGFFVVRAPCQGRIPAGLAPRWARKFAETLRNRLPPFVRILICNHFYCTLCNSCKISRAVCDGRGTRTAPGTGATYTKFLELCDSATISAKNTTIPIENEYLLTEFSDRQILIWRL
jgi:hypothetical protein